MEHPIFKRVDWCFDKLLICPECLETLFRDDIEHFAKCPYCDMEIDIVGEVEDFVLKPVVERWLATQDPTPQGMAFGMEPA